MTSWIGGMGGSTDDSPMLARPAAIKLLRPGVQAKGNEAAAQLAVKRFWREAEAAASLRSQHTVGSMISG